MERQRLLCCVGRMPSGSEKQCRNYHRTIGSFSYCTTWKSCRTGTLPKSQVSCQGQSECDFTGRDSSCEKNSLSRLSFACVAKPQNPQRKHISPHSRTNGAARKCSPNSQTILMTSLMILFAKNWKSTWTAASPAKPSYRA